MTICDLPTRMHLRGVVSKSSLGWAAVSLYVLSLFKYAVRDPLAANVGLQGPLEIALLLLALAVSVVSVLRRGRLYISSPVLVLGVYASLTLVSSLNSFYPTLSAAKAAALLGALALAVFLSNSLGTNELLRRFYIVLAIEVVALLVVGAMAPSQYPLLRLDVTGRSRLWLLQTHPGVVADYAAIALVLGMFVRTPKPFLFQLLFLGVLVACQGRVAIAATLVLLAVGVVAGRNRGAWTLRRAGAIGGLTVVLTAVVFSIGEIYGAGIGQGNVPEATVGQGGDGTSVAERTVEELASINGRTPVWGFTIGLLRDRILLGIGPDGARPLFLERFGWATGPHNGYLDVFLAAGWIGGVCFLVGWAAAAVKALRSTPLDNRVGFLLIHAYLGALAVLGGLVSPSTTAGIFLLGLLAQVRPDGPKDVGA